MALRLEGSKYQFTVINADGQIHCRYNPENLNIKGKVVNLYNKQLVKNTKEISNDTCDDVVDLIMKNRFKSEQIGIELQIGREMTKREISETMADIKEEIEIAYRTGYENTLPKEEPKESEEA